MSNNSLDPYKSPVYKKSKLHHLRWNHSYTKDDRISKESQLDKDIDDIVEDMSFLGLKKKKKSGKPAFQDDYVPPEAPVFVDGVQENVEQVDEDYQYQELLDKLYESLKRDHPHLRDQRSCKLWIPDVRSFFTARKTVLLNFIQICNAVKRPQKHVMDFLISECATSGSLDPWNRLSLIGKFRQKELQTIISKYVKEYVMCTSCKSFNTLFKRESRLNIIRCHVCGCTRVVNAIQFGFRAITSRKKHR